MIIKFCFATRLPIVVTYKGVVSSHNTRAIKVDAETVKEVLANLKGTNAKTISNINNIT